MTRTLRRHNPYRRSEYLLTAGGHALQGVIVALTDWGDRWAAPYAA